MSLFYVITPIAALLSVWFLAPANSDNDYLGKIIGSVVVMVIYIIFLTALGWKRKQKRQQKIRGAVLSPAQSKRVVLPDNPE